MAPPRPSNGRRTATRVPTPGALSMRDRAAMQPDEAAHQRQAQPGAVGDAVVARTRLEEGIAEARQMFRRDADAGVGDRYLEPSADDLDLDRHMSARAA